MFVAIIKQTGFNIEFLLKSPIAKVLEYFETAKHIIEIKEDNKDE